MNSPSLSVVIPVYNEAAGLQALFDRLYPALDALRIGYEVIFVNDGSRDKSAALLKDQFNARPDVTRVVLFNANYGQHMAIMAGAMFFTARFLLSLIPGIAQSITTTRGFSAAASAIASAPSDASPTTAMSGSSSSMRRKPRRTRA